MLVSTICSYAGLGHNVRLQRRNAVVRSWAIVDNRRVVLTSTDEKIAKEAFIDHVGVIVRQIERAL